MLKKKLTTPSVEEGKQKWLIRQWNICLWSLVCIYHVCGALKRFSVRLHNTKKFHMFYFPAILIICISNKKCKISIFIVHFKYFTQIYL